MARVRGRVSRAAKAAREKVGSVWSISAVTALECSRSSWTGLPGHCQGCNQILTGRRTAWCSDQCHRTFELNHIFSEARQHVLAQASRTCERDQCGVTANLQVNHIDPVVGQGYHPSCYHHLENLEALCRPHHQLETNAQRLHRQSHWNEDALMGSVTLPASGLAEHLRQDLIRRQLDRASGFPFVLEEEEFARTGEYYRYRPNTKWPRVQEDLKTAFPNALLWSKESQAWLPLAEILRGNRRCKGLTRAGRCKRHGREATCWQHSTLTG